ncbi:NAD-P-binding protein, partial [Neolentinus lepideus HHB14362 ss-1]
VRAVLRATSSESLSRPPRIRLPVHSASSIQKVTSSLPSLAPSSFVVAEYLDYSSLPPDSKNVGVEFCNSPSLHPNETAMGVNVINAAKQMDVKHFVLSQSKAWVCQATVEEYLTESSLPYTILQPSSFMQNTPLLKLLSEAARTDTITLDCWYYPDTLKGFLYLLDLAEIAASVLINPEPHLLASYSLVRENISLTAVSDIVSEETGVPSNCVRAKRALVKAAWAEHAVRMYGEAVGEWTGEAWERLMSYYDKRGIPGNNNVVRWLLGREPTTWRMWVRSLVREA